MWTKIKELTDQHGYMSGVSRMTDRVKSTGEVFTPTDLVIDIVKDLDLSPGKTVLDPACGDGQFLVVTKWVKVLIHGMTEAAALEDIYGVDIMRDNVDVCVQRLGGGNVVMGDTMNPNTRLPEQTDEEHRLVKLWFGVNDLTGLFG